EKIRTDAWELLGRLDKDGSKRAALLAGDDRLAGINAAADPLLGDLRAAAHDLRAVPVTAAELEWARSLRGQGSAANPKNAAWWEEATAALARLTDDQIRGLQIRHAEPVRWASRFHPEWLSADRGALKSELE